MKYLVLFIALILAVPESAAQEITCGFVMVTSRTNSSGITRTDSITYAFQGSNAAMIIHGRNGQPDMRMVFDPSARTITQLYEMNGRKGGFIFPMTAERWPGMAYADHAPGTDATVRYTGRTRNIQGHACREARVVSDKYNATAWVAGDIPLSMVRVFSYQSVGAGKSTEETDMLVQMGMMGLPLEMDLKSNTGKPDVDLRVLDFSNTVDQGMFSTDGYSTTWVEE